MLCSARVPADTLLFLSFTASLFVEGKPSRNQDSVNTIDIQFSQAPAKTEWRHKRCPLPTTSHRGLRLGHKDGPEMGTISCCQGVEAWKAGQYGNISLSHAGESGVAACGKLGHGVCTSTVALILNLACRGCKTGDVAAAATVGLFLSEPRKLPESVRHGEALALDLRSRVSGNCWDSGVGFRDIGFRGEAS